MLNIPRNHDVNSHNSTTITHGAANAATTNRHGMRTPSCRTEPAAETAVHYAAGSPGIERKWRPGLLAIVGGISLMGTLSINVLERTREIGVMRAIGASNGDIQWIVIAEGAAIGLISWLFSLLLAIPLTSVLVIGVGKAVLQAPIPYIYGMSGALTWLIGILLIAAVSSALPARQASRLTRFLTASTR